MSLGYVFPGRRARGLVRLGRIQLARRLTRGALRNRAEILSLLGYRLWTLDRRLDAAAAAVGVQAVLT